MVDSKSAPDDARADATGDASAAARLPAPEGANDRAVAFDPVVEWDEAEEVPFAPANYTLIGGGIGALAIGFVLLRQVNQDASNWQGTWAPIILLTGYVMVFLGILYVRRRASDE